VIHKASTRTRLTALAGAALASLALTATASAASREPMSVALAALNGSAETAATSSRPDARALRALESSAQRVGGSEEVKVSSTYYGSEQMGEVATILRRLDHGPELERLSVYLATAAEIEQVCGATVVACYVPVRMEMVVSGEDRAIAGVPRDFAIAHEYGHHIANSQLGDLEAPLGAGTIRWATYERVCQFTRAHELFPGDQGAHYWEDPEEAFAESYAHLNEPDARVSWQYTPLLAPSTASLTKIRADVARPWSGPSSATWVDSVAAPPASAGRHRVLGGPKAGIASATAVGQPSWISSRLLRTPLDGRVSIHLQASAGADYAVVLRDSESGRVLSRARTGDGGATDISYGNCGRDSLLLEVRGLHGAGTFEATVVKP
jgi:hypothetical protein